MTTTTRTTPADSLRSALKAAGFNSRRVTVRQDHSTLRVTVRDAGVSLSAIKDIASSFEKVRRCEASGEILLGGNTYVDVDYLPALVEAVAASILERLSPAAAGVKVDLGEGFHAVKFCAAPGLTYLDEVWMSGPGFDFRNERAVGLNHAAERLAIAVLDARATAPAATTGAGGEVAS